MFSCNLPPALLAKWPGSFTCYCGNTRHQNKSQHRKLTREKKILLLLLQGFEPMTFQSRVWRSNHLTIPAPLLTIPCLCVLTCPFVLTYSLSISVCWPTLCLCARWSIPCLCVLMYLLPVCVLPYHLSMCVCTYALSVCVDLSLVCVLTDSLSVCVDQSLVCVLDCYISPVCVCIYPLCVLTYPLCVNLSLAISCPCVDLSTAMACLLTYPLLCPCVDLSFAMPCLCVDLSLVCVLIHPLFFLFFLHIPCLYVLTHPLSVHWPIPCLCWPIPCLYVLTHPLSVLTYPLPCPVC